MDPIYKRIALGLAFSPRVEALLAECARIVREWHAELLLVHVGPHSTADDERLGELLEGVGLTRKDVHIFWETGKPHVRILDVCRREHVDLLVVGALKKENLVAHYLGSTARKILRRARCSVLMLTEPSKRPSPLKNIVVNAEDSPYVHEALRVGCALSERYHASWVHVVRELKLYSLTMSAAEGYSEEEYEQQRQKLVQAEIEKVHQMLKDIPHADLQINVKLLSGKSGFELAKFAIRKNADLLVVGASRHRLSFFDRIFTHDLEYIFADLPCNLLMVNERKEVRGG